MLRPSAAGKPIVVAVCCHHGNTNSSDKVSSRAAAAADDEDSSPGDTEVLPSDGVMDPDSLLSPAAYSRQEMKLHLSLDSLEDSLEDYDSDSLSEERRYQSELQNQIHINEENFLHTANGESEDIQKDGMGTPHQGHTANGESEDMGTPHQGHTAIVHDHSRSQAVTTSYSELRYDPDWRRRRSARSRSSEDEEDASPRYSDLLSPEIPGRSDPPSAVQNGTALHSHVQSKIPTHPTTQPAERQRGQEFAGRGGGLHPDRNSAHKRTDVDAARKDFIENNKATLGVHGQRNNSYLHLYRKNSEDQNRKTIVNGPQPVREIKGKNPVEMATSTEERGVRNGKERPSEMTNMESRLSVRKDNMEVSSEQPIQESPEMDSFALGRFRNLYLPQEDHEIHIKSFVNWNMKPQELTLKGNLRMTAGEILDGHSGSAHLEGQSLQQFPITSAVIPNLGHDTFLPQHNIPLKDSASKAGNKPRDRESHPGDNGQKTGKGHRVEEKNQKMLIGYLKQDVKLGGIGPSHTISQEKKAQIIQQKEYAKIIQERNRNIPMKAREMPIEPNDSDKGKRQKSLEYARSIPRPQQSHKASGEKPLDGGVRRAMSYDTLLPHNKLLEDLKARHQQEKVAVAAISALHIL